MISTPRAFLQSIAVLICALAVCWSARNDAAAQNVGGTLDPTFGRNGVVVGPCPGGPFPMPCGRGVSRMALQPDGRFVLGETDEIRPRRFTGDGQSDATFITTLGFSNATTNDVTVLADGRIVLVGAVSHGTGFAVAVYLPDGTLDASFGSAGTLTVPMGYGSNGATNILVQSDGSWLIAGWAAWLPDGARQFAITRLLPGGQVDTSFGTNGRVYTRFAGHATPSGLAFDSQGRIIVSGLIEASGGIPPGFAAVRYLPDGAIDTAFGAAGRAVARGPQVIFVRAVAVQDDDRIIVGGTAGTKGDPDTWKFALVRWTADGVVDQSFGAGGIVVTAFPSGRSELNALALQSDGKLVAGGTASTTASAYGRIALARYLPGGTLDPGFGPDGRVTVMASHAATVNDLVIQPDAKIVVAGAMHIGSLDPMSGGEATGMARFLP